MKTIVIKTADGLELVGKVDWPLNPAKNLPMDCISLKDPLEIRYRTTDYGHAAAAFLKYNYFADSPFIAVNLNCIVSLYDLSEHYLKLYEESVASINEEVEKRRQESLRVQPPESSREKTGSLIDVLAKSLSNTSIH